MMDLGWHATGIEPNKVAAERAVRWSGAEVMVDHFPSKRLASESFDLVSSQQVLEHLPSPAEAGREMARLLAPGGRLFISVPNSGGWSARQFGTGWIGWDVPRHQTHFTVRSLARWAIDAGLQVESIRAKPHVSWIQQSARRSPPGWVNQWARTRWGASMLARFTGWIGQGDSLLLWARKPSKGSKSG